MKEPMLIKAGDPRVKLGHLSQPVAVDCRVVAEENYQKLKAAYDKILASEEKAVNENERREELIKFHDWCVNNTDLRHKNETTRDRVDRYFINSK